jgi:hypothetical protein
MNFWEREEKLKSNNALKACLGVSARATSISANAMTCAALSDLRHVGETERPISGMLVAATLLGVGYVIFPSASM